MSDELASLEVSGLTLSNWESLTIQRTLNDIADAFSFESPFDPTIFELREPLRPFGFHKATVKIDDESVFVGKIEQIAPSVDAGGVRINVQGRSPAGVLLDCNFDPPYQFDGQTWVAIATKICQPFGVIIDKTTDTGPIKIAKASTGDTPGEFLKGLADGEGYVMVSTPTGSIGIKKIKRTNPVASIVEGVGSFVSATLTANGTARFSRTKAIKSMGDWKPVEAVSVDSAIKVYRPRIITSDGDAGSIQKAADMARSLSIAESCPVEVVVAGWKTDSGHVWAPGDFVTLKAPGAWIMRETEYIIDGISLELTSSGRLSTLSLVLPESRLGGLPAAYPWDGERVAPTASSRFAS